MIFKKYFNLKNMLNSLSRNMGMLFFFLHIFKVSWRGIWFRIIQILIQSIVTVNQSCCL